jgi:hypothetical protein
MREDLGSKPARTNSSQDPISKKKPSQKRADGVAQVKDLSSNPSTAKRKKIPINFPILFNPLCLPFTSAHLFLICVSVCPPLCTPFLPHH